MSLLIILFFFLYSSSESLAGVPEGNPLLSSRVSFPLSLSPREVHLRINSEMIDVILKDTKEKSTDPQINFSVQLFFPGSNSSDLENFFHLSHKNFEDSQGPILIFYLEEKNERRTLGKVGWALISGLILLLGILGYCIKTKFRRKKRRASEICGNEVNSNNPQVSQLPFSNSIGVSLALVSCLALSLTTSSFPVHPQLLLIVPPSLEMVKIFILQSLEVDFHRPSIFNFLRSNNTSLFIYDSPHVPDLSIPPCLRDSSHCLATCDKSPHSSCLCQRGFVNHKGICIDYDECSQEKQPCPPHSSCLNLFGSFHCPCLHGYFKRGSTCFECHPECLPGFFESTSCGSEENRICTACSDCSGPTYQVEECSSKRDRQCRHISHLSHGDLESLPPSFSKEKHKTENKKRKSKLYN